MKFYAEPAFDQNGFYLFDNNSKRRNLNYLPSVPMSLIPFYIHGIIFNIYFGSLRYLQTISYFFL